MPVRIVQSKQNARLKELRRALAFPGREGKGLAGIEGPILVEEALRAGLRIDCVFAAQGTDALREVPGWATLASPYLRPGGQLLAMVGGGFEPPALEGFGAPDVRRFALPSGAGRTVLAYRRTGTPA